VGAYTKVCLLGPLEVSGPGGALRLSGARQRAVFALLALRAPEVVSQSHLVDALWGDEPPPTAIKTLHSHVARIRQALTAIGLGDLLVTREPGYALALPPDSLDAVTFDKHTRAGRRAMQSGDTAGATTALRAGLALWRGDPLADCPVAEWGLAEIARLNEARADAEEVLAEATLGEHGSVAELERLVLRHPLRERFWELLVTAHHRGGRRAEALQAYRRARTVLAEELGVEPGEQLRSLEAAVLAGSPARPVLAVTLPSLVGRHRELAEVRALLAKSRLVTLTGPGGCGKTRLALAVAEDSGRTATFVDLSAVRAPALVADAVASALSVPEQPGVERVDGLIEALTDRDLLVVLDNCEHVVQACAELVTQLLPAHDGLTVLATSREALQVAGEVGYGVPPLAVPDPTVPRPLSELGVYDSVQLFLERAAEHHGPEFGDQDALPIAQLCAALDGLPLAIELAAARTPVLAPAQIVRRLRDRFGLLSSGSGPARHRALRAAMAWSHDLLSPSEAALFARLGVFVGGFTVDAVEAVWQPDQALDALSGLVAKSLVRVGRSGEATRFSMLETIAAYAAEQLDASPAVKAETRQRHAQFFLEHTEELVSSARVGELQVDHDNLRAALVCFAESPSASDELRMATALSRYCRLTGRYNEGRQWLSRALMRSSAVSSSLRVNALVGAASLALSECDYARAASYATEGLDLTSDQATAGRLLVLLGAVARERAQYSEALDHYSAAAKAFHACGNSNGVAYAHQLAGATCWHAGDLDVATTELSLSLTLLDSDRRGAASSLAYLGAVALYRGDPNAARIHLDSAMEVFGELDFKEGVAWALNLLGLVEHNTGAHDKAASMLQASLSLHRELGDRWRQASVLEALAAVACSTSEPDRAALLLHQAGQIRTAIGAPAPAIERPQLARTHAAIGSSQSA
jgi:predicted ATPase/DNA-binding SARP family transcriptional activator